MLLSVSATSVFFFSVDLVPLFDQFLFVFAFLVTISMHKCLDIFVCTHYSFEHAHKHGREKGRNSVESFCSIMATFRVGPTHTYPHNAPSRPSSSDDQLGMS